ncbi:MAG: flagellar motor protein MotB [Pedosphaera sp.]|nr:flagellar motor protein MotB [Pedosphaera sp.]
MSKKGHHGGAWKVAYADFVTAMMALFMVLWLTSQDQRIKEAVERAFRNPFSSVTKDSVGIIPSKDTQAVRSSSGNFDSSSAVELTMLRRLNQDLLKSLESGAEDKEESSVKLDLTPEGLSINVFDRSHKPIFEPQSTKFTPYGDWVFSTLAWEIARYNTFTIELEGHTESGHAAVREDYGDWEISADRANAVRRKLMEHGVASRQVQKVAGYGDTRPMPNEDSGNEINRRVTVLLNVKSAKL